MADGSGYNLAVLPLHRGRRSRAAAAAWLLLGAAAAAAAQEPTPAAFGGEVEVRRIVTEVRVVGPDGEPFLGLGPQDFEVEVAGARAEVESISWVPTTAGAAAAATAASAGKAAAPPEPEGRLIAVLFQVDPAFHASRTSGLLRMTPKAAEFVAGLGPEDRVALLVFRSHLQLRADFTDDHQAVADMLTPSRILQGRRARPGPDGPSLAAHLDAGEARDAASMAAALELIGTALQPIPGPKSLVLFGYALGRMTAGPWITIDDGYRRAMEALTAARTSVFALDITDADFHSLERGLRTVSDDTGGIYVKTHEFPRLAMAKLGRVISSYYELSIIPPPGLGDEYTIEVRVRRPQTEVHVRQHHAASWMF